MQKRYEVDITNLDLMFGSFCTEIFQYKDQIIQNNSNIDTRDIHKNLCLIAKNILDKQKSVSFDLKVREVVYIMVSLADEVFLNIPWDGKKYWEENMLEQHFFQTQIAGEKIFKKIDKLVAEDNIENILIAEIYMQALSLGFKGKYRGLDEADREINGYRKKLFSFVEKHDKSIDMVSHRMFSKGYSYTLPTIHRQFLPDASIINYFCAFFIFMFLVISSIVWIFETQPLYEILREISEIVLRV